MCSASTSACSSSVRIVSGLDVLRQHREVGPALARCPVIAGALGVVDVHPDHPIGVPPQVLLVLHEAEVLQLRAVAGVVPVPDRAGPRRRPGPCPSRPGSGSPGTDRGLRRPDRPTSRRRARRAPGCCVMRGFEVRRLARRALAYRLLHQLEVGRAVPSVPRDRVDQGMVPRRGRRGPEVDDDASGAVLVRRVDRSLHRVDGVLPICLVGRR